MVLELFNDVAYGDVYTAAAILIATLVASRLLYPLVRRMVHHFTKKTGTTLDDELVNALEKPVYVTILLVGSYYALAGVDFLAGHVYAITKAFTVAGVLLGAYTATKLMKVAIVWYQTEIAHKMHTKIDNKLLPLLNKLAKIIFFAVAGIIILNQLGFEVTPLLASLGIGGLAIALALQPTLANFFAGTYVMTEGAIKIGDFVELENGIAGFVQEIGSRSTKIKTQQNMLVVIPNSKLADSIIKNYHEPSQETVVPVPVGVSYSSDLEKVERVTLDVARNVTKELPEADKKFDPVVRFTAFGDSNIEFAVALGVRSYPERINVVHEFIKQLKRRYDKEGIEIAYPTTNIYFRNELPERKK